MKNTIVKFLALLFFIAPELIATGQTKFTVTFQVNMNESDEFNPETDDVYISGTFSGWEKPGDDDAYKLVPALEANIYELTLEIDSGEISYKYFRVINEDPSWDHSEWDGDPNRKIIIMEGITLNDSWGDKPIQINFWIDLMDVEGFNPAIESLYITGDFANDWAMPGTIIQFKMDLFGEVDDYIYTKTLFLYKGDHEYAYYRIFYDEPGWENGEDLDGGNRMVTVVDTNWMKVYDVWSELNSGIFESVPAAGYLIYPNPAKYKLNINDLIDVYRIQLFDVTGKLCKSLEVNTIHISMNIADLKCGFYTIVFHTEEGIATSALMIR
jgi:hypothetical protein